MNIFSSLGLGTGGKSMDMMIILCLLMCLFPGMFGNGFDGMMIIILLLLVAAPSNNNAAVV